jgi:hypothetical protein
VPDPSTPQETERCGATTRLEGYGPGWSPWTATCDREAGHDGDHWNGSTDEGWPRENEEAPNA